MPRLISRAAPAALLAATLAAGTLVVASGVAQAATADSVSIAVGTTGGAPSGVAPLATQLDQPQGIATDAAVGTAVADLGTSTVRFVPANSGTFFGQAMTAGKVYTIAGDGAAATSGDGGPAAAAGLSPSGVAFDGVGNLYILDTAHSVVRVVCNLSGTYLGQAMTAGDIYTVAGTSGASAYSGDGGPATSATLDYPEGIAIDASGDLYIADTSSNHIRFVPATSGTYFGRSMAADDIYSIAGDGNSGTAGDGGPATSAQFVNPSGVALDAAGNLLVADSETVRLIAVSSGSDDGLTVVAGDIYGIAGTGVYGTAASGTVATSANLGTAQNVAVDAAGNIVIAEASGYVSVVAESTGTFYGQAMTAGDYYHIAGSGTLGFSGAGGPATAAVLGHLYAVAVDAAGTVLVSDTTNHTVWGIAAATGTDLGVSMAAGNIYELVGGSYGGIGDGGPATSAYLDHPTSVAVTAAGAQFVVTDSRVRFVPAISGTYFGQTMTAGDVYTVAGTSQFGAAHSGVPATSAPIGEGLVAVATDAAGDLLYADGANNVVQFVPVASGTHFGVAMTAGNVYTLAGDSDAANNGIEATSMPLSAPMSVAVDSAGNVYLAEANVVQMVPASSGTYFGQAMMAGNLYTVAGSGSYGTTGDGGPASAAAFETPVVTVDSSGDLVIDDTGNHRVRFVPTSSGSFYGQAMTADDVYTIAGGAGQAYTGDGGPATSATMMNPVAVAVDAAGNLAIADEGVSVVRYVPASTGTYFGQSMVAGDIYTVAGTGTAGYSSAALATGAEFDQPQGVALTSGGTLYVADTNNDLVREVLASTSSAPSVTSAAATTFTVGTAGSFTVRTSGSPSAIVSETGALPSGVSLSNNGNGTATLAGTPAVGSGGVYAVTITADNGQGTATQSFALTVDEAPAVTSAALTSFPTGASGTFTVTTRGYPAPTLTESGTLPTGVTFTDNGDGTATLAGSSSRSASYLFSITAHNGIGADATQSFALTVVNALPSFTSPSTATFVAGTANSVTLSAVGAPIPALTESGTLPTGLTFTDNGDGTATLAGTVPVGDGGPYPVTLSATNGAGTTTQHLVIGVEDAPTFTAPSGITVTQGLPWFTTITTTGFPAPAITATGTLPAGLVLIDNGDGTATIEGTPQNSGATTITLTADNGIGTPASTTISFYAVPKPPTPPGGWGTFPSFPTPPGNGDGSGNGDGHHGGGDGGGWWNSWAPNGFTPSSQVAVSDSAPTEVSLSSGASPSSPTKDSGDAVVDAPRGALPPGTLVGLAAETSASPLEKALPPVVVPLFAVAVTWATSTGAPTTASAPVAVTLSGAGFTGGDLVFAQTATGFARVATVPASGKVTVPLEKATALFVVSPPHETLATKTAVATSAAIRVQLGCTTGQTCQDHGARIVLPRWVGTGAHRHRTTVVLAQGSFALAAGHLATKSLHLTKLGRDFLAAARRKAHGRLRFGASLVATATDGNRLVGRIVIH